MEDHTTQALEATFKHFDRVLLKKISPKLRHLKLSHLNLIKKCLEGTSTVVLNEEKFKDIDPEVIQFMKNRAHEETTNLLIEAILNGEEIHLKEEHEDNN